MPELYYPEKAIKKVSPAVHINELSAVIPIFA